MPKRKKSLRTSNRLGSLIGAVDAIRDYGIFMLDANGIVQTWNRGAENIKGYKAREIVGRSFELFYTPEDIAREHPKNELKIARKTGRYEEEGWRVRKDGTRFWANVVITRITDDKRRVVGFSKVTRDLTARRETEQRLRESEERFRLLVEGVKDYAIYMLDPGGVIASWNQGAERIKGYPAGEVLGKYFSVFYPPEDIASGKCEYELREAELTGRFEDEGWRVRKDGTRFWASVVLTAIRDPKGRLIGFTKVTRDLTERKRAEDKLQLAYAGLERRIAERTQDLAEANTELEEREASLREAVRSRDEFLSIASHELKTPITSLKMNLQILQLKMQPGKAPVPPERVLTAVDRALGQVDRLTKLVEDLLDVARAQSNKLTFELEEVELGTFVAEIAERMRGELEAAGCSIALHAPAPVQAFVDKFRMDQVFVNLFANAMKYAPGTAIDVHLKDLGDRVCASVRDAGPGISADEASRLFQRFERGANARNLGGLGLGLFISKQIVEGHGGTIRLGEGPGACFIIELPTTVAR